MHPTCFSHVVESRRNVIKAFKKVTEQFQCEKTQIGTILHKESRIVEIYEENATCQNYKGSGILIHYQWYCMATSRNLYPLLMEKAKEISRHPDGSFKASNGELKARKKRHNIKVVVSGESGDISGDTISSWKERLPEIIAGY